MVITNTFPYWVGFGYKRLEGVTAVIYRVKLGFVLIDVKKK